MLLDGVLFDSKDGGAGSADTVMIAITGIHGNFYSNPFYYNIGNTLNSGGIDFIYAQTNDVFGQIETLNVRTNEPEIIGSWNERFAYNDDDIDAYLSYAEKLGCKHIILAGHSLGANKAIYYLSRPLIREPDLINRWQKSDRLYGDSAYYIKLNLLISHNVLVNTNKMCYN